MMYSGLHRPEMLVIKLRELGYDINHSRLIHLPKGYMGCIHQEGLFENGKMQEVHYYDLYFLTDYFKQLENGELEKQLHERGYDFDPIMKNYFPVIYENEVPRYDIEGSINVLNGINLTNVREKLSEQGYELTDAQFNFIEQYPYYFYATTPPDSRHFSLDLLITYLTKTTKENLREHLLARGFDLNNETFTSIKENIRFYTCESFFHVYNVDEIVEYLQLIKYPQKVTDMRSLIESRVDTTDGAQKDFFNATPQEMYRQVDNIYSRFPIYRWYAERYKTIPDICFVGQVHYDEMLDRRGYKLRWCHKRIASNYNEEKYSSMNSVRNLYYDRRREYITDALLEIEDGMFILLFDGCYNSEKFWFYATAAIFYKEGIHDTTETLRFLFDHEVHHEDKGSLGLLYHSNHGFDTHNFTIPKPEINFDINYNKGFSEVHDKILAALSEENGKGLVLLHGKPGTGKTTYIRYLINQLNKNKIFVPPNLTEMLADPGFIPFLMNNTDCVLFVEDAENVLRSREGGRANQAVSNILNITDGLLSDCLNIQIVATFNTDLKNIDSALLRKGRLIAQYEFTELESDRAEKLADSLKLWLDHSDHLTLADIYAIKPTGK